MALYDKQKTNACSTGCLKSPDVLASRTDLNEAGGRAQDCGLCGGRGRSDGLQLMFGSHVKIARE
jgi:hypothetical protein